MARALTMRRPYAIVVCCLGVVLAVPIAGTESNSMAPDTNIYVEDFDEAWTFVRDTYAYFEDDVDWTKARDVLQPRAARIQDREAFIGLLEELIEHLCDHHAHLGVNTPSSPRLIPSGSDLWAEHRDGEAYITDVRPGSNAERAGLRPKMQIFSINDRPTREAVTARLPVGLSLDNSIARDWALRTLLAGCHNVSVTVEVRDGERDQVIEFEPGERDRPNEPLTSSILELNIGYVRIHDSLGFEGTKFAWDAALDKFTTTRGLILDLRDTPGGGNTRVARALIGRLISVELPYQRHELPNREQREKVRHSWVERVKPRGLNAYDEPVAVLVGRWTASMGEGVAIGLDAMQRARVFGSSMAGLRGAIHSRKLTHTNVSIQVPAERLYHVNGTPREAFVPEVVVEQKIGEDAPLIAAIQWLDQL